MLMGRWKRYLDLFEDSFDINGNLTSTNHHKTKSWRTQTTQRLPPDQKGTLERWGGDHLIRAEDLSEEKEVRS